MTIAILGGGASGMMAALTAARSGKHDVLLIERQARLGRKLLSTGNGRCNLSNTHASSACYHGTDAAFCTYALQAFGAKETLEFFESMGLVTVTEPSGRVYPYSNQANSVLDVLRFSLELPNLQIYTGCEVKRIRKRDGGYLVKTDEGDVFCDRVIVACGGMASAKLGGTDIGYRLLESLGHKRTTLCPALVPLVTEDHFTKSLKGVRAQARIKLCREDDAHTVLAESQGEVQFTELGISGPAIFEISRAASVGKAGTKILLDLLPQMQESDLTALLRRKCSTFPDLTAENLLTGILHNRLGRMVIKNAGVSNAEMLSALTEEQLESIAQTVKCLTLVYASTQGMEHAQVTAGGIKTEDFDPQTMESRIAPGIYACGEVLDIDGDCGGLNLQWAWSSGHLAGLCAANEAETAEHA